ncbi:DNA recombination protein RmuC [Thiosulfatimonas sediminis]|uniref:DNA recombination protein RmuC n=1 Tax=Thiosulfatimonas sediminis TaxID=2675054 RepID=A0A6F8PWT0_9GAMM|nr:DNA recombination protein RmuC [Thiosulfatimonas sediminis]BBP46603.1 DNA recombination protein RmuC [Thiosulfatimonas sediminis]
MSNDLNPFFWPALLTAGFFIFSTFYLYLRLRNQQQILSQYELSLQNAQQSQVALENEVRLLHIKLSEFADYHGQAIQLEKQLHTAQQQLLDWQHKFDHQQALLSQTQAKLASLETALQLSEQNAADKLAFQQQAKQQLESEFKNLATQIFEHKKQEFSQLNRDSVHALLQPMQLSMEQFKQRIETTHKESLEGRASLQQQLKQLQELNSQMSEEAKNLTHALKGDSKVQGNWGELVLERLLERSGLREGFEFAREKSFQQPDGSRLRPDVVLNLPDNKHVIIDSKVSLKDYEASLNTNDSVQQNRALKNHLQSLRKHIDMLSIKRYEHLALLNAPDFVLMFIPVEGAYLLAIEQDASIFEDAFDKRVAVVTPTTLFTSLKTIEQLWRYERQSENTVKLVQRAAEVHDKFVGFIESFEKIGKQLETAQGTYQQARARLTQGNGNLIRQAEMLKELAGKTKKELPQHLVREADGQGLLNND